MRLHLTMNQKMPAVFSYETDVDAETWEAADDDQRNDIIAKAMRGAMLKLVEDDLIQMTNVRIDGVEYVEE